LPTSIIMPKQGNTVEQVLLARWLKRPGEPVQAGEVLCEVETDKAVMEVESSASGVLLEVFYKEGDTVPVMTPIAVVGEAGEAAAVPPIASPTLPAAAQVTSTPSARPTAPRPTASSSDGRSVGVSPRARALAAQRGIDPSTLRGTGPEGRVIERDVMAAASAAPMTPLARSLLSRSDLQAPPQGTGIGGRVTARDLVPAPPALAEPAPVEPAPAVPTAEPTPSADVTVIPLRGVRKVTAERMRASLLNSAQLTLNASADARALQALRQRFKASPEALGLRGVTLNDLLLFAVARTLPNHPELNATLDLAAGEIVQHRRVHLGMAVDTPRGLLVPIIRDAHILSLKALSEAAAALAQKAQSGRLTPDEMQGGTFTVSNLGSFGVESFTPVINPPQVAILGVGNIQLKPVMVDAEVQHLPHIGLSLTIDHQVVDGAPGARFLRDLSAALAQIDLLLAV
jgi:pyruvate dehydrogenase E2 component (dihydrolipoamide acetyltransferase)